MSAQNSGHEGDETPAIAMIRLIQGGCPALSMRLPNWASLTFSGTKPKARVN